MDTGTVSTLELGSTSQECAGLLVTPQNLDSQYSHANGLAEDILIKIFKFCTYNDSPSNKPPGYGEPFKESYTTPNVSTSVSVISLPILHPDRAPLKFCSVSRRWRKIALGTPTLWTRFTVETPYPESRSFASKKWSPEEAILVPSSSSDKDSDVAEHSCAFSRDCPECAVAFTMHRLRIWLTLSRQSSITFYFHLGPDRFSPTCDDEYKERLTYHLASVYSLLVKEAGRWKDVYISGDLASRFTGQLFEQLDLGTCTRLESLFIRPFRAWRLGRTGGLELRIRTFNLRHPFYSESPLAMYGGPISRDVPRVIACCPALRSLRTFLRPGPRRGRSGIPRARTAVASSSRAVGPFLEELVLIGPATALADTLDRIHLPIVKCVVLTVVAREYIFTDAMLQRLIVSIIPFLARCYPGVEGLPRTLLFEVVTVIGCWVLDVGRYSKVLSQQSAHLSSEFLEFFKPIEVDDD